MQWTDKGMEYPYDPFNPLPGILPYQQGLMVGRFQHIHRGHEYTIGKGLRVCRNLLILVGSSQEEGTIRNPFDVAYRKMLMEYVYYQGQFGGRVTIGELPDMTNEDDINYDWGRWVLRHAQKYLNGNPLDLMIYGNDENRAGWFDPDDIRGVDHLVVSRGDIEVSATKVRGYLAEDNSAEWRKYANPSIHRFYGELREKLLQVPFYRGEVH